MSRQCGILNIYQPRPVYGAASSKPIAALLPLCAVKPIGIGTKLSRQTSSQETASILLLLKFNGPSWLLPEAMFLTEYNALAVNAGVVTVVT
jgi:hypothetical protein